MFCQNCGNRLKDGSRFCDKCGARVDMYQPRDRFQSGKPDKRRRIWILILVIAICIVGGLCGYLMIQLLASPSSNRQPIRRSDSSLTAETTSKPVSPSGSISSPPAELTSSPAAASEAAAASAQQKTTEVGVHRYEYIIADISWSEAFADCIRRGGYLAHINDREEYEYILGEISAKKIDQTIFWVGGRRMSGSNEYYWVDSSGSPYGARVNAPTYWCASEWYANEPSFNWEGQEEMYLDIFYKKDMARWFWNDEPDNLIAAGPEYAGRVGYICEFED